MAKQGLYRGFSSYEYQSTKSFRLNDVELVKMDLLNHIFTRRGERVMMATFGTIIPDLVFEPLNEEIADLVKEEIFKVINYDPRVELISLEGTADYDKHTLLIAADVFYIELGQVDNFELNIGFEG